MKRIAKVLSVILLLFHSQNAVNANSVMTEFVIAPYLLEVDKESATVAFHLENRMNVEVLIHDNDQIISFKSEEPSRSHFIKISGLQSGRTYNYQVICGNGIVKTPPIDNAYQIRTACNKGESFSFVVFGDPRPGENQTNKHHKKVIERVIQNEPSFILVLGDMVDDGADLELWEAFFLTEKNLLGKAAIYPVIGDNDFVQGKGLVKHFFPVLERGYYHFKWGDVHFFGLNAWDSRGFQSKSELDAQSEQLKWLESQLSKEEVQNSLYRIVFLHDPVLISRGYSSEILKSVWEPVFSRYNVDLVFSSWHMYERSQHNGIRYIISGGGGAELIWLSKNPDYSSQAEAKNYHFCRVDVNAGAMTISAIDINDTILDSFTISPKNKTTRNTPNLNKIAKKVRQEIFIKGDKGSSLLTIHLFSCSCSYCHKLLNGILDKLAKQYQISLKVYSYNLELHENIYDLLLSAGADFGRQNSGIPSLFLGKRAFYGKEEIENNLENEFNTFRQNPEAYVNTSIVPFKVLRDTKYIKENTFDKLSFVEVFKAGLLDGVRPGVLISLMVLIAFLILTAGSPRAFFIMGLTFLLTMFLLYMVIGLVFFNVALIISEMRHIAIVIKWVLLLSVILLAVVSKIDRIKSLKSYSDKINSQLLQLSQLFQNISINVPTAFILGAIIAGMDLACKGQIYMSIVTMILEPTYRAKSVKYLSLYNLAFMLPIIFIYFMIFTGIILRKTPCVTVKKEKF
ncbi:MAG: hypothetical protein GY710_17395 [Desulfobacteraceae bacterium]|nr:hypothetical protein [Desulfobacteraceae bacterium]